MPRPRRGPPPRFDRPPPEEGLTLTRQPGSVLQFRVRTQDGTVAFSECVEINACRDDLDRALAAELERKGVATTDDVVGVAQMLSAKLDQIAAFGTSVTVQPVSSLKVSAQPSFSSIVWTVPPQLRK